VHRRVQTVLADSGVVYTDVVVTQSKSNDEAGSRQLHLCRHADEVRRFDARLVALIRLISVTDFTQCLGTQRHRVGQMYERTTNSIARMPHTWYHVIVVIIVVVVIIYLS